MYLEKINKFLQLNMPLFLLFLGYFKYEWESVV